MTNVLVIYMDDMRADQLAYMPQTRALFDREFTQARASGGACTDTRLGLFSGNFVQNHPWNWINTAAEHDADLVWGTWMQAAGYRTGMFGEYITTDVWTVGIEDGWDTWRSYFADAHEEYGFSIDDGSTSGPVVPITPTGRNLDYMTAELLSFVDDPEPWFAVWSPQHPHTVTNTGGLHPRPVDILTQAGYRHPVPLNEDVTGKPPWVQALDPLTIDDVADIRRAARGMARVLAGVDDAIVEIFAGLETLGQLDDTIVFFSSDQGVHFGEHRWGSSFGVPAGVQKQTIYDEVARIAMLARGPGFTPGRSSIPVSQVDITATVVAVAGATAPHPLDGLDLRLGGSAARELLLGIRPLFTVAVDADAVVTGPGHPSLPSLKYVLDKNGFEELYDLSADPGEFVNLAGSQPSVVAAMSDALSSALAA